MLTYSGEVSQVRFCVPTPHADFDNCRLGVLATRTPVLKHLKVV